MIKLRLQTFIIITCSALLMECDTQKTAESSKARTIVTKACQFLWDNQGDDGGWHSKIHGLLRGGQAYTPFILFTLMEVPESIYVHPREKVKKALQFIRSHVNREGALGLADPDVLEYPNYSTSYALRVMVRYGRDEDKPLIERMKKYILDQQFVEHRGITPDHLAYSSWGFGELNLRPGAVGHVDLSHTRRVLQALREAGHHDLQTFEKAKSFLRLLQKHPSAKRQGATKTGDSAFDGGFYFSPIVLDANKAGYEQGSSDDERVFRSYATATCDGVLSLFAAGFTPEDESVQAAIRWMEAHPIVEYPQGIPEDDPDQWHKVLFYYHLSVRSEVYRALQWQGKWRQEMIDLLAAKQRDDGSFANPYGSPNKEDDPLLATAFAVGTIASTME